MNVLNRLFYVVKITDSYQQCRDVEPDTSPQTLKLIKEAMDEHHAVMGRYYRNALKIPLD